MQTCGIIMDTGHQKYTLHLSCLQISNLRTDWYNLMRLRIKWIKRLTSALKLGEILYKNEPIEGYAEVKTRGGYSENC